MLQIYGIKNCDSVRKAIKYFKAKNIDYEFVDFRQTPIDLDTINRWLEMSDIKTLLNTRGTTYRTLGLKQLDLSDDEKRDYLAKENMLIKRPVVVFDNNIIVGYNESEYLDKIN